MREISLAPADLLALARKVRERGGTLQFHAKSQGASMIPLIRDGDELTVEPTKASLLRRCDVAVYDTGHGLVAHRLIGRCAICGEELLLLQGDNCSGSPERVRPEQVMGRVIAIERGGRRIDLTTRIARRAARLRVAFAPMLRLGRKARRGVRQLLP